MNNKIWTRNHYKQIECTRRHDKLEMLRNVLLAIKSEKEQRLIYRKRVNR